MRHNVFANGTVCPGLRGAGALPSQDLLAGLWGKNWEEEIYIGLQMERERKGKKSKKWKGGREGDKIFGGRR